MAEIVQMSMVDRHENMTSMEVLRLSLVWKPTRADDASTFVRSSVATTEMINAMDSSTTACIAAARPQLPSGNDSLVVLAADIKQED